MRRNGLAARLFTAQLLTLAVGAVTLFVVTVIAGPAVLGTHLNQALGPLTEEVRNHIEEGYLRSTAITVGLAGLASLAAAIAVSLLVTKHLTKPIGAVRDAATQVAAGLYETRVPDLALGSEMKQLTDSFNVMASTLEHTERSRQQLLGDVAHELRTPLATIRACHEALADGVRKPDQHTWALLANQTDRIERLIDDIALVSRAEENALALNPRPTPIDAVLAAAISMAAPQYQRKGVELSREVPPQPQPPQPLVSIDPERIVQVLSNLMSNALRHTPTGGHVRVCAGLDPDQDPCLVRVTVTDDGEGISSTDLPHIFQRFYRTDSSRARDRGGSGIGLTVARALVAAHGGTLTATSAGPGTGSTFIMSIPATAPTPR